MADGTNHASLKRVRFGPFRFHLPTGELERGGATIVMQHTPARLLAELISACGDLVPREAICAALWPNGVHIEFENNLNNAVARLRQALGHDGRRYIQTIPRRGYRFTGVILPDPAQTPGAAAEAIRKAHDFRDRMTVRDLWRAIDYFREAIDARSDFAAAYAGMSDAYMLLGDDILGGLPPEVALTRAEICARSALSLDPGSVLARTTLAMVDWRLHRNWKDAESRFLELTRDGVDSATPLQYYSWLLQARKRSDEARRAMLRARALAPDSLFIGANVGWMLYLDRRYVEARGQLEKIVAMNPGYGLARLPLGYVLQQTGRLREALGQFRLGYLATGDAYYQAALAQALAHAGFKKQATSMLGRPEAAASYNRAMIHARLGEPDETFRCLDAAVHEHSSAVTYLAVEPIFDGLRNSAPFRRIQQQVGLG